MENVHIFLDFDGTLIDSSHGIYNAFRKGCVCAGLQTPNLEEFRKRIGPPVEDLAKQTLPDGSPEELEKLVNTFRIEYDKHDYSLFEWYDGVLQTLHYLSNKSTIKLSIVTNKPTVPTLAIINEAGLVGYFESIVGIDYCVIQDNASRFPNKAAAIDFTINLNSCRKEDVIYVGDTLGDRNCCQNSGVTFIAATYGFHRWTDQELGQHKRIVCFRDMIAALNIE